MRERLGVRTKLVALAAVAAAIGVAATTVASRSHSQQHAGVRAAPVVTTMSRAAEPRRAPRQHVQHAFRPPVTRVRAVRGLPPTGFGLGALAALAFVAVAAGLLFRLLAAEL